MTIKWLSTHFAIYPAAHPNLKRQLAIQFTILNDYEVDCRHILLYARQCTPISNVGLLFNLLYRMTVKLTVDTFYWCPAALPNLKVNLLFNLLYRMTMKLTAETFHNVSAGAHEIDCRDIAETLPRNYRDCRDISQYARQRTAKRVGRCAAAYLLRFLKSRLYSYSIPSIM